jgi:DNA-binding CsgD family transcriptional regulator
LDQGKNLEVMSEVSKFNRLDGYGIFLPKTTSPAAVKYWTTFFNDLKQDKALVSDYNNMDCVLFKEPGNQELLDIIKSNETFTPVIKKEKISLTVRQEQIADLIIKRGYSNQKIAQVLNISESTVKFHAGIVYKKYGVQTRTQLIASS